jgi:hypothetical protein
MEMRLSMMHQQAVTQKTRNMQLEKFFKSVFSEVTLYNELYLVYFLFCICQVASKTVKKNLEWKTIFSFQKPNINRNHNNSRTAVYNLLRVRVMVFNTTFTIFQSYRGGKFY